MCYKFNLNSFFNFLLTFRMVIMHEVSLIREEMHLQRAIPTQQHSAPVSRTQALCCKPETAETMALAFKPPEQAMTPGGRERTTVHTFLDILVCLESW